MESLYEIDQQYKLLFDQAKAEAEENNGQIPDDLAAKLDAVEMTREIKIENCIKYYKNESALANMIEMELDALERRIKAHEGHALWMKQNLASVIEEGHKVELSCGKVGWRASQRTEILDETALPENCFKITKSTVLNEVKTGIEAGTIPKTVAVIKTYQNIQIK